MATTTTTTNGPSAIQILTHLFLTLVTAGAWLFVIFFWYIQKLDGKKPSVFLVIIHLILTAVTSGFWFILVLFWYIIKPKR